MTVTTDQTPAMARALVRRLSHDGRDVLTPQGAARFLGLPGSWTVRRLEARGEIPVAPRSLAHGDRYYDTPTLLAIVGRLKGKGASHGDGDS